MKMPSDSVFEFIATNPGTTTTALKKYFGGSRDLASVVCLKLFRQGRLSREALVNASNGIYYAYTAILNNDFDRKREPGRSEIIEVKGAKAGKGPLTPSWVESLNDSIGQIATAIAQQIIGQVGNNLANDLTRVVPETPVVTGPSVEEVLARASQRLLPPPTAPSLRRIVVTGLLPQQAGVIQAEFGDCFDIRFWNDRNGDGVNSLKAGCLAAEVVFHHVRHGSHATDEIIKSSPAKMVRVLGGMSQMKEALTNYYAEVV